MNSDWSSLYTLGTVDEMYDSFYEMLFRIYGECFPIVTRFKRKKDITKLYITAELKSLTDQKKKLERKYYKKPITYGDEYRKLRNKVNKLMR